MHLTSDMYLGLVLLSYLSCMPTGCGFDLAPSAEAGTSIWDAEAFFEIPTRRMHAIKGKSNQAETDHKPVR